MWGLIPGCWSISPEVQPKLALFPLRVCFPLSQHQDTCLREEECWSMWGQWKLLACVRHRGRSGLSPMCCLCRYQYLFPSLQTDATLDLSPLCPSQPITAASLPCLTLLWSHIAGCSEPAWTLSTYWDVSCGGVATFRDLECSWCTARVSANNSCHCSTQALPQELVTPVSHGRDFSSVMAAPDPVLCCDMEQGSGGVLAWLRLVSTLRQSQGTQQQLEQYSHCLVLGASQHICFSWEESKLPIALFSVLAVLQPAKCVHLPSVGPQD